MIYPQFGMRKKVTCEDVAMHETARQMRQDFWRRESLYQGNGKRRIQSTVLLLILFFFTLGVWQHASFFYSCRGVLWVVLVGLLAQIPIIRYIFRSRRGS